MLRRWLEALELERVALVGHSLGGLVCARVAARAPELVERLVLVAPAGVSRRRGLLGHLLPLAATACHSSPGFLRVLAADAVRAGPRALLRSARELLAQDVTHELRDVRAPTLLVWGERDDLVPASLGEVFARELPDARLLVIPGARHVPMVERPREFEDALVSFLG